MLKRLSQQLDIALGSNTIALVRQEGWWHNTSTLVGKHDGEISADGQAEAPQRLDALLGSANVVRLPARIVLEDVFVRTWRVEPPRNATRVQDLVAAAAMRFASVFEESLDDWVVSSMPSVSHTFLACAVRRSLADDLGQVLSKYQLSLTSMEPEFVTLWNHWRLQLRRGEWFGIFKDSALLLGIAEKSRLVSVRRLPVPAFSDKAWLVAAVQREADRLNLAVPAAIGLCGNAPSAWVTDSSSNLAGHVMGQQNDALSLFGVAA